MRLHKKTAIVTGGALRLGQALAFALAERGVAVALHYGSSQSAAQATVAHIRDKGGEAFAVQADLADAAHLSTIVEQAVARYGGVDILVNNAAVFEPGDIADTTEENWDHHMDVNLKAPFFLSQAFARQIRPGQRGHIINLADWRGARPDAHYLAYTLTKSALLAMTESLALALAPDIQVNAIAPGAILPPPGQDATYLDRVAKATPLRRAGSPEEVVKAMLYLLDSNYATGETIFVTGGQHLL